MQNVVLGHKHVIACITTDNHVTLKNIVLQVLLKLSHCMKLWRNAKIYFLWLLTEENKMREREFIIRSSNKKVFTCSVVCYSWHNTRYFMGSSSYVGVRMCRCMFVCIIMVLMWTFYTYIVLNEINVEKMRLQKLKSESLKTWKSWFITNLVSFYMTLRRRKVRFIVLDNAFALQ